MLLLVCPEFAGQLFLGGDGLCAPGVPVGLEEARPGPHLLAEADPQRHNLDYEGRAWWLPSQTGGGAIPENRIVLPIPPGTHWSDAKPWIYPEVSGLIESSAEKCKALEAPVGEAKRARRRKDEAAQQAKAEAVALEGTAAAGGLRFGSPTQKPTPQGACPDMTADEATK